MQQMHDWQSAMLGGAQQCHLPPHRVEHVSLILIVLGFTHSSQLVGLAPGELNDLFDASAERQFVNRLIHRMSTVRTEGALTENSETCVCQSALVIAEGLGKEQVAVVSAEIESVCQSMGITAFQRPDTPRET